MHSFRLHGAGISRGVTVHAHGFGAGADHFVSGSLDCVIAVAGDTTRKSHRGERVLVRAGLEQLRLEDVAIRADIGDVGDPRGCGSVVAMAGGAGGRAQVASYHHGVMVHTLLVVGELVGLDAVGLHVLGIGVTMRAGSRNVGRMHVGARIGGSAQIVHAVAVGTHRDFGVTLGPLYAVDAGLVLLELVNAQSWVV